jgi:hypothetical protein
LERGAKPKPPRSEEEKEEEEESAAEKRAERHRRGKGRKPPPPDYISIPDLAFISREDPRRIYEAIKAKKLKATKHGMRLRVEKSSADQFTQKALQKHQIHDLVCRLEDAGKKKEAIRKRVYRLRRAGLSDAEVIERLRIELSGLRAAEPDLENEIKADE